MTETLEQPLRCDDDSFVELLSEPVHGAEGGPNAVEKALVLLAALGTGRPAESLSSLAARTSMPRSTVCRILRTMESQDFVARKGQLYCLGPRVAQLGRQAELSEYNDLRNLSLTVLERLFADLHCTVHLAVPSGSDVLLVEKITAPGAGRIPTRVGATAPAACTAIGKALLAFADRHTVEGAMGAITPAPTPRTARSLPELTARLLDVRRSGFAVDHEEFRAGVTCVAAPVLVGGRAVAAVSASSTAGVHSSRHSRAIATAAQRLGAMLGSSAGKAG